MQLAVALYNNNVDDEDELEFRKGDILTVLIENPNGFDGWWLCKRNNKCGLCPENRLKLIQNTTPSSMKSNDFVEYYSRLSTISMYDSLSNCYDNPTTDFSSSHDYDNQQRSDFITNIKPYDSSPESSSRSSGIYSTNDLHLSSSSTIEFGTTPTTDHETLSSFDLNQLQDSFQKLSIRSSLVDIYRQLISQTNIEYVLDSFTRECHLFLRNYGCLLDRYTYKLIKETFLPDLELNRKRIVQLSTKIIQLIKLVVELRLKEQAENNLVLSKKALQKLHLDPLEEMSKEKGIALLSTTQLCSNSLNKNHRLQMKTSQTCGSNFITISPSSKNNDHDDKHVKNPLMKCYYRHINEQSDLIIQRYSHLLENDNTTSMLVSEGKALVVAGHKLVFVLETLHEHVQQTQMPLTHLTTQLYESLTSSIQLLKQFSAYNCTNIRKLTIHFRQHIQMMMNIVQRIKQNCSLA